MTDTIVVFSVWASNTLKMRSWMTHAPVVNSGLNRVNRGLAPSAATRAGLSASRGSPADALGDLRVRVRPHGPLTPHAANIPSGSRVISLVRPTTGSQPRPAPVPFFPEVHEELTKSWMAPFTARSRMSTSSILITLDGGVATGYVGIPQVERAIAVHLCPRNAATWRNRPRLLSKVEDQEQNLPFHFFFMFCFLVPTFSKKEQFRQG